MRRIARGFTLVELIVVIVVLSILYFTLMLYPGTLLNVAPVAQQFAQDIRYTQNLAMTRGQIFYLSIDSAKTYSIHNSTGVAQTHPYTHSTTLTLGNKLTFSSITNLPNNVISFNTQGYPYTDITATTPLSGIATICFQLGSEGKCIAISPGTGYVSS